VSAVLDREEFDYVVVGSGAAGSALAHRLCDDPEVRVLLLEAGAGWIPADVDVAPRWFALLGSEVDWGYQSVPQPGLGGRRTAEPRGRMPGGSSNLYIMMHVQGHPSDFDAWAYGGAAGWSYADLQPYFARSRQQVSDAASAPNPLSQTFLDACAELGYRRLPGFNDGDMVGAGWHELDVHDGRRFGAMAAHLEPALGRPNLTLRTCARATGLVVEGGRCTGVRYLQGVPPRPSGPGRALGADPAPEPGPREVRATGEVVVCAGAIESPKLLLLSGIGPADRLRGLGLPVVADRPGVGENFHNHVLVGLIQETLEPVAPGRQNLSESALFTRSDPGLPAPDLQLAFVHVPFDIIVGRDHPNAVSILPGLVRPNSRGTVRLAGPDPLTPPLVDTNYLGDRSDLDRLVEAFGLAREIFATRAFAAVLKGELIPGQQVRTRTGVERFVRDRADSYHHQAGTCRIGVDDGAVVDPRLRVHGVAGLRVADASVMPAVPSGNPHTAIVAIGERAADLIEEDRRG